MPVEIMPPISLNASMRSLSAEVARTMMATPSTTSAEWPMEKKNPTENGRLPCCISLRTTLSIAAM